MQENAVPIKGLFTIKTIKIARITGSLARIAESFARIVGSLASV
jgi:hypothetical protein